MKQVEIYCGITIDKALEEIKAEASKIGEDCCCDFNGKQLFSTDTLDEAYMKVTGKTKAEKEEYERKWLEDYEREKAEHKAKIPQLTEEYRKKGRGLVIESELGFWDEAVPIRLGDLYHGMELDCTLDLCRIMRDESIVFAARLEKAYDKFKEQGHSGMSAGLVMSMLRRFCPDGNELAQAIKEFRFEKSIK